MYFCNNIQFHLFLFFRRLNLKFEFQKEHLHFVPETNNTIFLILSRLWHCGGKKKPPGDFFQVLIKHFSPPTKPTMSRFLISCRLLLRRSNCLTASWRGQAQWLRLVPSHDQSLWVITLAFEIF